jgi:hypothetical protein
MVDEFAILSGGLLFDHERAKERDWLVERAQPSRTGKRCEAANQRVFDRAPLRPTPPLCFFCRVNNLGASHGQ